jgi:hypothetical protein
MRSQFGRIVAESGERVRCCGRAIARMIGYQLRQDQDAKAMLDNVSLKFTELAEPVVVPGQGVTVFVTCLKASLPTSR